MLVDTRALDVASAPMPWDAGKRVKRDLDVCKKDLYMCVKEPYTCVKETYECV